MGSEMCIRDRSRFFLLVGDGVGVKRVVVSKNSISILSRFFESRRRGGGVLLLLRVFPRLLLLKGRQNALAEIHGHHERPSP